MTTQGHSTLRQPTSPIPVLMWPSLGLLVVLYAAVLVHWPDNFFADDSYFYFQVASNFARGLGSTFNGLMPTNGYHPLWMLVCAAIFRVEPDKFRALHAVGMVIALLNWSALLTLTLLLRRAGAVLPFAAWLLYLPFCFCTQLGTEGALSGACLASTLLLAFRFTVLPQPRTACLFSCFAALAVLSRLDNIFIIAALSLGLVLAAERARRGSTFRLLLLAAPIAFLLWGTYLYTNRHWFGTWQPISGLLKAHSRGEHQLFSNLPHIAILDLLTIAICLLILSRMKRDLFHRSIELPVAVGILLHAIYIVFIMSSETRWSWYYTSWTLLAAVLIARVLSVLVQHKPKLQLPSLAAAVTVLLALYLAVDLPHFAHGDLRNQDPGFQTGAVQRAGLRTLLAFDKPGRIAYYSNAEIIPLDGLMGDLRFQQDLARTGIGPFIQEHQVDGFIGPPQPMDEAGKRLYCDHVFLSSVQFHCVSAGPGLWQVDRAHVFARLTQTPAGSVSLNPTNLAFNQPGYVAAWRLNPEPRP